MLFNSLEKSVVRDLLKASRPQPSIPTRVTCRPACGFCTNDADFAFVCVGRGLWEYGCRHHVSEWCVEDGPVVKLEVQRGFVSTGQPSEHMEELLLEGELVL